MAKIVGKKGISLIKRIVIFITLAFWIAVCVGGIYTLALRAVFYPLKYEQEIFYLADYYGLDRALVLAVVKVESSFNESAKSSKGAVGLMQIMPSTAEYIATKKGVVSYNLNCARDNLDFGCYYLKYLNQKFGSISTAIVAYNAGEGRVREWLKDSRFSTDGVNLHYIEYVETREYLVKVEKTLLKYKKLYGKLLDK